MKGQDCRRLARWGWLGLPLLVLACQQVPQQRPLTPIAPRLKTVPADPVAPVEADVSKVRFTEAPAVPKGKQPLPISLDAVLRLAEEQNPQISLARAKVATAFSEKQLAQAHWIPDVYVGVAYYRHQGGIQLQEGPLVNSTTGAFFGSGQVSADFNPRDIAYRQLNAARKLYQDQGELSKITNEQLLEATTTYIDLLSAHAALAISQSLDKPLAELNAKVALVAAELKRADIRLQLIQIESEIRTQKQTQQKLQSAVDAASAKLNYLLGLESTTVLVPIDQQMTTFHLVDASPPLETLVAQALSNGPGIREIESILGVIQTGMEKARGGSRLLPNFTLQVGDGLFAAGPNNAFAWAHRFDLAMQARWNLTDAFQQERKRRVAFAQLNQVAWTYEDLRAKLTLGVADARGTIQYASGQFAAAKQQIDSGKEALALSEARLKEIGSLPNVTYTEVMQAQKAIAAAQLNYIDLMREFDKAQLRLLLLLGPECRSNAPGPTLPEPHRVPKEGL